MVSGIAESEGGPCKIVQWLLWLALEYIPPADEEILSKLVQETGFGTSVLSQDSDDTKESGDQHHPSQQQQQHVLTEESDVCTLEKWSYETKACIHQNPDRLLLPHYKLAIINNPLACRFILNILPQTSSAFHLYILTYMRELANDTMNQAALGRVRFLRDFINSHLYVLQSPDTHKELFDIVIFIVCSVLPYCLSVQESHSILCLLDLPCWPTLLRSIYLADQVY